MPPFKYSLPIVAIVAKVFLTIFPNIVTLKNSTTISSPCSAIYLCGVVEVMGYSKNKSNYLLMHSKVETMRKKQFDSNPMKMNASSIIYPFHMCRLTFIQRRRKK